MKKRRAHAELRPREQWCGPLRSFLKEFNHPPTLFGARATSSLSVQYPALCDR